ERRTANDERRTSAWQFYGEPRPVRRVVADLDASAVLRDDATHDRKPQTAAAPLRRVVRQEQLLALGWRNARAVVGDDHAHQAVGFVALRLHHDPPAALHRLDRIVDQVDDDAADLLGVESHERDAGRELLLDPNFGEDPVV